MNLKEKNKSNEIIIFSKPKYIYIPLIIGKNEDITLLVKKNDYVFKGTKIGKSRGENSICINSSISGTVVDIEDKLCFNNKLIKCVKILNDYKEEIEIKKSECKNIYKYTKEEFIKILKECGIIGLGGGLFPTYIKYKKNIKTLIINATECEPYIEADYIMIENHIKEILEAIDAIMEINKIGKCYFAIKKDKKIKQLINRYLGTYLKIKLIETPDVYPIGWERLLIKYILNENYNNYPIEKNIVVNNVSTIYAIYEALKYHKPLTERIVTFSGLINTQNILIKNGTSIKEVFDKYIKFEKKENLNLIAGGPMMGESITSEEFVFSLNVNGILILPKDTNKQNICIRCGKCNEICPSNISPILIRDNLNKKCLEKLNPNKCIECGLCSYICPSKINLRQFVRKAKRNIK